RLPRKVIELQGPRYLTSTLLSRRIPSPSLTSCFGALQPPARLVSLAAGLTAAALLSVLVLARWEHGRAIRPLTTPVHLPAPVVRRSGPELVVPGPSRARGAPDAEREGRVARLPRRSGPFDRSQPALTIPHATSGRRTGPDNP